jgi:hypothetical protein
MSPTGSRTESATWSRVWPYLGSALLGAAAVWTWVSVEGAPTSPIAIARWVGFLLVYVVAAFIMIRGTWLSLEPPKDGDELRRGASATKGVFAVFILGGLLALLVYASHWGPTSLMVRVLGASLLLAGASLLVGALAGFLFGIPRYRTSESAAAAAPPQNGAPTAPASPAAPRRRRYESNTNLEQISDWLTKIIVGVTLTKLSSIGPRFVAMVELVRGGYGDLTPPVGFAFVAALLVHFAVTGFLFGYLATSLYLIRLLTILDQDIDRNLMDDVAAGDPAALSFVRAASQVADLATKGTAKATRTVDRLSETVKSSDPNKGRFGGSASANGRVLSAKVEPVPFSTDLFRVRMTVEAEEGAAQPLEGEVQFHLHPTFRDPAPTVPVENGRAVLEVLAYGAFTVGAVCDGGRTQLELDLAELPDAPAVFRNR